MTPASHRLVETLNRGCYCVGTDLDALRSRIESDLAQRGLAGRIVDSHPHLFSALPVFVSPQHTEAMGRIIAAAETVIAMPWWRDAVLIDAPPIAQQAPAARGVFMGYDFHLGSTGPQLIEINTNAGGAFLNATIGRAQRACCAEVEQAVSMHGDIAELEDTLFAMFQQEWRRARSDQPLRRVAIVDSAPQAQYLYPEFLLAQRLFEAHGIEAVIADPAMLSLHNGELMVAGQRIDLVYNRLTDFYFDAPEHALLKRAYAQDVAVITPHPHAHALYAHKHNLVLLTDADLLRRHGVDERVIVTLIGGIPRTVLVRDQDTDTLWQARKDWFFKPASGFGSRGVYRGEKLTRKVFAEILKADYVAQAMSPPSVRHLAQDQPLKVDFRNYVYDGQMQLVAARLYQGQTTNFRTPGGGFAPVYHPPKRLPQRALDCGASAPGSC